MPLLARDPPQPQQWSDLWASIWQFAYVTTDLDRACLAMQARSSSASEVVEVDISAAEYSRGGELLELQLRVAHFGRGGYGIEVIEPVGGDVEFFREPLPTDGSFAIQFHHVATIVPAGEGAWAAVEQLLEREGLAFHSVVAVPGRARCGYVDTRATLGHSIEICQLGPEEIEFFRGLSEPG